MFEKRGVFDRKYFLEGLKDWGREFRNHKWLILISLVIVLAAVFLEYYSGIYVTFEAEVSVVPDLILDHIGPYDLSFVFIYGYILLIFVFFTYPLFFHIRQLHKVISQFSLLLMLRSLFMIFTHLQTPLTAVSAKFPWIFNELRFSNDMFFSGHTAIPFLGFLLFKGKIRWFFLLGSFVMAATALLTHQHYSIDVFAAFFITYGSYKIGKFFLDKIKK